MKEALSAFFKQDSAGGILLMITVALALIMANSPLAGLYDSFLHIPVQVRFGALDIDKNLLLWINDGLMAIFFLLIGLEVKRELMEGALSSRAKASLPTFAAIGGMIFPALFYVAFNYGDSESLVGWAIPAATDIAFALGILALLGSRVPVSLKVFLLALAIIDDLGVIVIIALFYSSDLSVISLLVAAAATVVMMIMNRRGVSAISPYMLVGLVLWVAVLKSGIHATLAGVVIAFCIPLRDKNGHSPAIHLEHAIHPWSSFFILPIFAFANAGLSFSGMTLETFAEPITLGIMLGLLLGKPIGVVLFSWIAVKLNWAELPTGITWRHIIPIAFMCGIGFTMSIFISSLAFQIGHVEYQDFAKLGIFSGSIIAAIIGYVWLDKVLPKTKTIEPKEQSVSSH